MPLSYPILIALACASGTDRVPAAPTPPGLDDPMPRELARSGSVPLTALVCALGCFDQDPVRVEAALPLTSAADTLTSALLPTGDTHIRSPIPDTNRGTQDRLWVRGKNGRDRSLVQFDTAAIRAGVGGGRLTSAALELTVDTAFGWGGSGRWLGAYRMLRGWTELGATFNCADDTDPGNGTFDCDAADQWDMMAPPGTEFAAVPTDTLLFVNGQTGAVQFDVTADIQALLDGSTPHLGWMLARTDETSGGKVEFSSREGGSPPRLVLGVQTGSSFPALPPDSIPLRIFAESNTVDDGEGIPFVRGVVSIIFHESASPEQREAAVDAVSGTVIGGEVIFPNGDGEYVVELEGPGDRAAVNAAVATLESLPQVYSVIPIYLFSGLQGSTPADPLWQSEWTSRIDRASGDNWALEAIGAPLAWGCTPGSSTIRLSVLDGDFLPMNADLIPLLNSSPSGTPGTSLVRQHGNAVATVAAARGDNGVGTTGVAWRSQVELIDVGIRDSLGVRRDGVGHPILAPRLIPTNLRGAAIRDSRIANLSLALPRLQAAEPQLRAAMDQEIRRFMRQFRYPNDTLSALPALEPPLMVISAGNQTPYFDGLPDRDALWSLYPMLKDSFPTHALVVTAMDSLGVRIGQGGPLVDLIAPGQGVVGTDGQNLLQGDGTSFAVPLVTGAAGLLMSFDPGLSISEVRDLLIQGAVRGGRTVDGIPVLNAYESLKLAAERPGGPLCGNRVWLDGRHLVVRRSPGVLDTLYSRGANDLLGFQTFHGGRRIDYFTDLDANGIPIGRTVSFDGGDWVEGPQLPLPTSVEEAPIWGADVTHEGDSMVYQSFDPTASEIWIRPVGSPFMPGRMVVPGGGYAMAVSPLGDRVAFESFLFDTELGESRSLIYFADLMSPGPAQQAYLTVIDDATRDTQARIGLVFSHDGAEIATIKRRRNGMCTVVFRPVSNPAFPTDSVVLSASDASTSPLICAHPGLGGVPPFGLLPTGYGANQRAKTIALR